MKRRNEEAVTPLSSLIDVVFLLIIFFIVTASVQQDNIDDRVELAKSQHVRPEPRLPWAFTINVRQGESPEEVVYTVRNEECNLDEIERQLRIQAAEQPNPEELPVIIRAGAGVRYREIDAVNRRILRSGLFKVKHATLSEYKNK